MQTQLRYISTFDTLRAIAVLMVLVTHSGLLLHLPISEELLNQKWIVRWGHYGVNLFFVLSGFLITRILISQRGLPGAYRNFVIRRSLRIFPIYYITIALLLITKPGWHLLWASLYATNYTDVLTGELHHMSHAWSLSVEEHFYLMWSPIVLFASYKLSKACAWLVFPLISITSVFLILKFFSNQSQPMIYRSTNTQIFALATGSVLAYHERWITTHVRNCLSIGVLLIVLSLVAGTVIEYIIKAPLVITRLYSYTLFSAGLVCICIGIDQLNHRHSLRKLMCTSAFSWIGRISYGVYLYHFPIFLTLGLFPPKKTHSLGIIAIGFVLTLIVAGLSYHWIERPLLELKKKFMPDARHESHIKLGM